MSHHLLCTLKPYFDTLTPSHQIKTCYFFSKLLLSSLLNMSLHLLCTLKPYFDTLTPSHQIKTCYFFSILCLSSLLNMSHHLLCTLKPYFDTLTPSHQIKRTCSILLLRTPEEFAPRLSSALTRLAAIDGVEGYREHHFWRHSSKVLAGIISVRAHSDMSDHHIVTQVSWAGRQGNNTESIILIINSHYY